MIGMSLGEIGTFFIFFHNLGGIFQIRLCSITYRCASLSSAFTEVFVLYVKMIQMFDPPWKAVNVSVFVVAEVQLLLASAKIPCDTVAMNLSVAGGEGERKSF